MNITVVNGQLAFVPIKTGGAIPLRWLGGDLLQMEGLDAIDCTYSEWGLDLYVLQFQRGDLYGDVVSFSMQGLAQPPSANVYTKAEA